MDHKFVESENDERRHCAYCGFYEDYAELHCPARAEETKLIDAAPDMYKALKKAQQFITNGIEMGYIRMPDADSGDTALETPGIIQAALAKAGGKE